MHLTAKCSELLSAQKFWGYHAKGPDASEPTAWVCLAMTAAGEIDIASTTANWLVETQSEKGSVGVTRDLEMPAWTTSLACLAWLALDQKLGSQEYSENINLGREWLLSVYGKTIPKNPIIGHDPTLIGWSWAADTHSWMEPTCLAVLALKALGYSDHPRTREGVRLINDRLLKKGGCNFGSTDILGQATLPQVQSSGFALLALADEKLNDPRIPKTIHYLESVLEEPTSTASLSYGILGLTAHHKRPALSEKLLENALDREIKHQTSAYKLALIILASLPNLDWLPKHIRAELALQ